MQRYLRGKKLVKVKQYKDFFNIDEVIKILRSWQIYKKKKDIYLQFQQKFFNISDFTTNRLNGKVIK